jgi:hypothetical protein
MVQSTAQIITLSADGIQMKPTTQQWHVLTVVNGSKRITWPSATLSSTGSTWPGQVKSWVCVVTGLSVLPEYFLGEFAKLQKATISFAMSVHLSTRNNPAPTGWICMKFDI